MFKDPTDVTRRKPRRLRGTPAYRVTRVISLAIVSVFTGTLVWFTNSQAAWIQRFKAAFLERFKPTQNEADRRKMFTTPYYGYVAYKLDEKAANERDGIKPDPSRDLDDDEPEI